MTFFRGGDYRTHLSSKQYLQSVYNTLEEDWEWFRLRQRHDFFARYSSKWDKDRAKYLEFGGGAVVVDLISAEPHVAEIVHAAHTEDERKEIGLWVNKQEDAHDWAFAFKHVVGELESKEGDEAWKDREAALRSKIKIISCDILKSILSALLKSPRHSQSSVPAFASRQPVRHSQNTRWQ